MTTFHTVRKLACCAAGPRTLRGGAWYFNRHDARVSYRNRTHPEFFNVNVGVRIVVAPVFLSSGS